MRVIEHRDVALVALASATDATAQLAAYVTEGPQLRDWAFGDTDVAAQLAEALKRTAQIELCCYENATGYFEDEAAALKCLIGSLDSFLAHWSGQ